MSEPCDRCGEDGEDRRTLWMACLYQMGELGVPFEEMEIEGVVHSKTGERSILGGFRVAAFSHERTPIAKHRFFTLRVCKRCRADWMAAIRGWFASVATPDEGVGMLVRELGATRRRSGGES